MPRLSRRSLITGLLSSAAVIAVGPGSLVNAGVGGVSATQLLDAARIWKLRFAAEFAKAVDVSSCPNVLEMLVWITAEADGAFNGLDDPLNANPIEEAREATYAIGACA